ncbi:MAG: Fpg/Nei family DNA glycosylase [Anaerolineae bacterium]
MPELPDLEIIREVLERKVVGLRIASVEVPRPLVVRVLDVGATEESLAGGRVIRAVSRRGKCLLLELEPTSWIVGNAMLAGRWRLCPRAERLRTRDYFAAHLEDGSDLRFHDVKGMGKVYLAADLSVVPGLEGLGPDALDPALTLEDFITQLHPFRGEIKGVLTRGEAVAGIGNAYADEILYEAGIYPFRKRTSLKPKEQAALYTAMRTVLARAIVVLRERVGEDIENEVRDFLQVHGKKGEPCPRCGQAISEINVAGRGTNFCRRCQPGTLLRGQG